MTKAVSKHEMNLTQGKILKKLLIFAAPLVFTNILQLLFNATDIAVLGILVDDKAVGAVSATTALISLLVNVFVGLSVGSNVVLSKCVGMGDVKKARRVVGTSFALCLSCGAVLVLIGQLWSKTFLVWMGCPSELLAQASVYLEIYFIGVPIILFYNFAASMLRAVGDTFRPMLYMIIAGVANVGLNVFFIVVFDMTVEGVAIGTVASQAIASVLAFIAMRRSDGFCKFQYKNFRFYKQEVMDILKVGLPSGLQSSLFGISNVLISSTVNSFGAAATTGSGVAAQFDAFVYTVGYAAALACMSFVSQNLGAGKPKRIKKVVLISVAVAVSLQVIVGGFILLLSEPLMRIMSNSPDVLEFGRKRLFIMCGTYFLCGTMDTLVHAMRALGKSTTSMLLTVFFVCVFRIIWLKSIYLLNPTFEMIFYSYIASWVLNVSIHAVMLVREIKRLIKKYHGTGSFDEDASEETENVAV